MTNTCSQHGVACSTRPDQSFGPHRHGHSSSCLAHIQMKQPPTWPVASLHRSPHSHTSTGLFSTAGQARRVREKRCKEPRASCWCSDGRLGRGVETHSAVHEFEEGGEILEGAVRVLQRRLRAENNFLECPQGSRAHAKRHLGHRHSFIGLLTDQILTGASPLSLTQA